MVIVDSAPLIHLVRIGKLDLLKKFFGKVKTPKEVIREVTEENRIGSPEILKAVGDWIVVKEVEVRRDDELEKGDLEVIALAEKENDIILTNDLALILIAKTKGLDCWWLTTFLLKCLYKGFIEKQEAKGILLELVKTGLYIKTEVYAAIASEIETYTKR